MYSSRRHDLLSCSGRPLVVPPRERAPSRRAMPEDARRQQIRKQLAMPDIRAVSVFQSHLEQGLWRSRHIQALAAGVRGRLVSFTIW